MSQFALTGDDILGQHVSFNNFPFKNLHTNFTPTLFHVRHKDKGFQYVCGIDWFDFDLLYSVFITFLCVQPCIYVTLFFQSDFVDLEGISWFDSKENDNIFPKLSS